MADIPAANITNELHFSMGTLKAWKAKIKGDGTGVTVNVPFNRVEFVVTQAIDDSTIPAPVISASGGILTYAVTPTNGTYHWLIVAGY
jgi:hypothetical protein